MTEKLIINGLYKVFGSRPEQAMQLIREGKNKDEIFERTGQTVGVRDANFSVMAGEIFVVMGLSGSGKSTIVRLLNRLIEPTAGQILFDGQDITQLSGSQLRDLRRQDMSMVFQSFALMPHMTVAQNAAFGLELAGHALDLRRERAMVALAQVGLEAYADSYPDELSGGMQQRVGLARALANDPSVLLMDEAFSALDPLIRSEMQDELLKLQSEHQRTIVFISHDLDEAMRIGDRIAIMEGGRVVQVGTPEDILRNPADDYVRSFFRGVDIARILKAGDIAGRQQVTIFERESVGVRPALQQLQTHDRQFAYVLDKRGIFHGVVSVDSLMEIRNRPDAKLSHGFLEGMTPLHQDTPIGEVMTPVAQARAGLPVVDDEKRYKGVISKALLLQALDREE